MKGYTGHISKQFLLPIVFLLWQILCEKKQICVCVLLLLFLFVCFSFTLESKISSLQNLPVELIPVFLLKLFRKSYNVFPYSWVCFLKLVYLETNSEIFLLWFWNSVLTPSRARVSMQSESLSFFLDNCHTNRNKQTQPTKHLTKETSYWNHINLQCRTWATPQQRKFANPSLSYLCLSEPYFSKSYTPLTCFLIWVKLKKLNWSSIELNKWIQRQYIAEWNSF